MCANSSFKCCFQQRHPMNMGMRMKATGQTHTIYGPSKLDSLVGFLCHGAGWERENAPLAGDFVYLRE